VSARADAIVVREPEPVMSDDPVEEPVDVIDAVKRKPAA